MGEQPRLDPIRVAVDPKMIAVAGYDFAEDRLVKADPPKIDEDMAEFNKKYANLVRTVKVLEKAITKLPKDAAGLAKASDSELVNIVIRERDESPPAHYVIIHPKDLVAYLRSLSRAAMSAGEEDLGVELADLSGLVAGNLADVPASRGHLVLGLEVWRAGTE